MITRLYIKNCLSFKEVDLEFNSGLNIFTGPSGAGKSILMQEILALFAFNDVKSELSELEFANISFEDELYGIEKSDDLILKRVRNLINGFAGAGLSAYQTTNDDLRRILDNFLNGGQTTTFGTVLG